MMSNVTEAFRTYLLGDDPGNTTPWALADNLVGLLNITISRNNNDLSLSSSTETAAVVAVTPMVYEQHVPKYPQAVLITLCVFLGCMIVATVMGNVFVITAILIERSLQGVSNYLVLSLAVTDLLVAVLVMPLSLLNEVSVYWYLGRALCDMWVSVDVLCCTASILHLVAIAVDRFWAVSKIDYVRRRCAKQILLMIAIVWLVSVAISIPPLFGWRHETDNPELTGVCMISQDHGYTIFSTVGAFYCPLVLMLVLNFKIYRAARFRIRRKGFAHGRRKTRGGHVTVPLVQVEQETTMRDPNRNSSGSDVSQDGISMFNPSCIINHEMSRADTGLDSYTGEYDQQYSYYGGDSTTDSNQNESYYPVATEDPDPPPSPNPCFMLGPLSRDSVKREADDRLCVENSAGCNQNQMNTKYRSFSSNHLTAMDTCQTIEPPRSLHLSASDVSHCVACEVAPYRSQCSEQLDVAESNCVDVTPVQIVVRDCDESSDGCAERIPVVQITVPDCDATANCSEKVVPVQIIVPGCDVTANCAEDSSVLATDPECDGTSNCVEIGSPVEGGVPECDVSCPETKLVQFDTTIRVDGDDDVTDNENFLTPGEDDSVFGDDDNVDDGTKDDGDLKAISCGSNDLLNIELKCVLNHVNQHNHVQSNHVSGDITVAEVQKDGCNQLDSRCLHTANSNSSPSTINTTTTTSSGTYSGHHGNQLKVPRLGTIQAQQPRKARANNNTKRARNREKEKQRREKLEMRRERKAARVLGIITGAFVLCWLPFFIMALLVPFLPAHCYVPPVLISLFLWLGYFNSLLNPIIYTVFNPSFRKAFRKIFFKRLSSVTRS